MGLLPNPEKKKKHLNINYIILKIILIKLILFKIDANAHLNTSPFEGKRFSPFLSYHAFEKINDTFHYMWYIFISFVSSKL